MWIDRDRKSELCIVVYFHLSVLLTETLLLLRISLRKTISLLTSVKENFNVNINNLIYSSYYALQGKIAEYPAQYLHLIE